MDDVELTLILVTSNKEPGQTTDYKTTAITKTPCSSHWNKQGYPLDAGRTAPGHAISSLKI
jgi:hypothetical protein